MKSGIEWQVSSLELSKRLRNLGVKQESLCYWNEAAADSYDPGHYPAQTTIEFGPQPTGINYSAFTVAELGEMLPSSIHHGNLQLWKTRKGWTMAYYPHHKMTADTEADARAKMLVYLLENKLINL